MVTAKAAKKPDFSVYDRFREIGFRYNKRYTGTFGIEIETETKGSMEGPHPDAGYPADFFTLDTRTGKLIIPIDGWEGHVDNSLRNFGREFVLQKPLDFNQLMDALDRFGEATKGVKFIKNAPATSVHVHVNMLPERPTTMANFLTLYTLFENVLVDYSGESRRSNLFALPMRVSGFTNHNLVALLRLLDDGILHYVTFDPRSIKYSALNIAPLNTQGSVEIRSFRGETDVGEIKAWVSILNKMLEYARKAGTPPDILERLKVREVTFFDEVFEEMGEKILASVNDISTLMDRNLWFTLRLVKAVKNWEKIDEPQSKSKKAKKEVIYLTEDEFGDFNPNGYSVSYDPDSDVYTATPLPNHEQAAQTMAESYPLVPGVVSTNTPWATTTGNIPTTEIIHDVDDFEGDDE